MFTLVQAVYRIYFALDSLRKISSNSASLWLGLVSFSTRIVSTSKFVHVSRSKRIRFISFLRLQARGLKLIVYTNCCRVDASFLIHYNEPNKYFSC